MTSSSLLADPDRTALHDALLRHEGSTLMGLPFPLSHKDVDKWLLNASRFSHQEDLVDVLLPYVKWEGGRRLVMDLAHSSSLACISRIAPHMPATHLDFALECVACTGRLDVMEEFLRHRTDSTLLNKPFQWAVLHGHAPLVDRLYPFSDVEQALMELSGYDQQAVHRIAKYPRINLTEQVRARFEAERLCAHLHEELEVVTAHRPSPGLKL